MTHYVIEGGAFDRACAELLTREFSLSWLDRFPPECPKPRPVTLGGDGGDGEDGDEDEGGEDLGGLDELAELVELPPEVPPNRSNRNKYRCPSCRVQVWGKPGLRLMCGGDECEGVAFEVVE